MVKQIPALIILSYFFVGSFFFQAFVLADDNNNSDLLKHGGELVIGLSADPPTFNHSIQSGAIPGIIGSQIFASPIRFDKNWKPLPYLAETWELSKDGLSLTLHLVKNATFHDGQPITSEDVAFSVLTVKTYHPFNSLFKAVERIETPDTNTAIIRLKHPHPAIFLCMSPVFLPILPKHIFGDGQDIRKHSANFAPVGSGPFKFIQYVPRKYVLLERYDRFFIKDRPYLDKIRFKIFGEIRSDIVLELQHQSLHMCPLLVTMGFGKDNKFPSFSHLVITNEGYEAIGPILWLAFNLKQKPFDDIRVRQALAYTIDREYITNNIHNEKGRSTGPISTKSPFYSDDIEQYKVNIKKANELLDDAGYPRDKHGIRFSATLDFQDSDMGFLAIAQYLRYEFAHKIGVDIKLRAQDTLLSWMKRIASWDFQITLDAVYNWGDPVIGVHRTYDSRNIRKGVIWSNTQQYNNPIVDSLLDLAAIEINVDKRKALYAKFQKIVMNDLPVFPIAIIPYFTLYHRDLIGLNDSIWGPIAPFDNVYWRVKPGQR
ncbi:MAG: ABC transporter substrate-binding protein [Candidatus Magnetomorum sp.]|nr:ABC transporter substrate-binding protein [Candidatus Magnetomorum sp.]